MSERHKELADLYLRGANEAAGGEEISARNVLDILDVFGENGVRSYMLGVLEGLEAAEDEWEEKRAELAYEVPLSAISVLEEDEDRIEIWIEECSSDLEADGETDLHILDEEDEIIESGVIVEVEFKGEAPEEPQDDRPAKVTIEKYKFEFTEYQEPWNFNDPRTE